MNDRLRLFGLIAAALLLGLVGGELLYRCAAFRDLAGRLTGRGRLVAIAQGKGIYETDLGDDKPSAGDLVVLENLRRAAANEKIDPARVDREIALLAAQFGTDKAFRKALHVDGLSISSLRETVAAQLRGLAWLEKQVRLASAVTEPECRQFFEAHRDFFTQPVRFRVSHLFLAAHAETPPDDVEQKEVAIAALAKRLGQGEALSQLAAEASEDEASKPRGGDLGFFAERRMPPEFISQIRKLRVGEISKPFRSHLGFHIAQVTEIKPARLLGFEEVRLEVFLALANERRSGLIAQTAQDLSRSDH
jgi:parvulin-like peptidyl-prolyl isomerase